MGQQADLAEAGKAAHTGEAKAAARAAAKVDANGKKEKHGKYDGLSRKQKRRKMANDEEAREAGQAERISAAIRSAKKSSRPVKITEPLKRKASASGKKDRKKVSKIKLGGKGSAFDGHEGMRAKPVKVALDKKKSGGKGKAKAKVGKR